MASIDGLALDRFQPGQQYEVGNALGALFLAEGWAEPVPLDEEPAIVPFSEADPHAPKPLHDDDAPPNLTREHYDAPPNLRREHYPPDLEEDRDIAVDFLKRKRGRRTDER